MKTRWTQTLVWLAAALVLGLGSGAAQAGVELPTEVFALPVVAGNADIQIWDMEDSVLVYSSTQFRPASVTFTVAHWDRWYVITVWDRVRAAYIVSHWFGHFRTHY